MPIYIDRPGLLLAVALFCSPVLLFTARWFFDDFETFLREIGYRHHDDVWWKLIRVGWVSTDFWIKLLGFVGSYAIFVGLAYYSLTRVLA